MEEANGLPFGDGLEEGPSADGGWRSASLEEEGPEIRGQRPEYRERRDEGQTALASR